jgi:putative colanic acid biosynthesis glycosyltransferase
LKVLQINTSLNSGSTGRIASEIGDLLIKEGHESAIAYGRTATQSSSLGIRIGDWKNIFIHVAATRLLDRHGFSSKEVTKILINRIIEFGPDVIHLHNIHGYYIHVGILFKYLKVAGIPIIWTFHDCWPFTGHCSFFDRVNCTKWQSRCFKCPLTYGYPKSWFFDNSKKNFDIKKSLFTGVSNMVLISPSSWLAQNLKCSFLKHYEIKVINNGVDLDIFKPIESTDARDRFKLKGKYIILGVANVWDRRKGLDDFVKLRFLLDSCIEIVLVGLKSEQIKKLPDGIRGISRTENTEILAGLYSVADILVNPTYVDNFPTVNLEALACGTPVVSYNSGGSAEAIDSETGAVIPKGDLSNLKNSILDLLMKDKKVISVSCRNRAVKFYNKNDRFMDYISIYKESLT